MQISRRFRSLRLAIIVLIALSFAVVMTLVFQLRSELRLLQEVPVDSLEWNVTQLELDAVRFVAEARIAVAAPDTDLTEVRRRFDLFYSRASSVLDGQMFARLGLTETVAPMKKRMREFLARTSPHMDGTDADLLAALPDITATARDLRQDIRAMTISVIDVHAALQDTRRARLTDVLQKIGVAGLVLILLLLALLGLVLSINRQADRRTREVRRITSRLEATVSTSLDGVIVAGMDGRVVDYNASAQLIFGYTRDEALGQILSQLIVPPQHRAAHDAGMARMRATGVKRVVDAGRVRMTAMRKSGEEFPVELSIASSAGPDGTIFIAYIRDISESQRAETALVAARDKAQAAEQTKTNFIAVMSHEMRTPLNGVIGALDILDRTALDARQKEFLNLAHNSAQQLLRHVKDVLEISRVEAGHTRLQVDRFDLAALMSTVIDPLRPVATRKGLVIDVHLLGDCPGLRGDPFRIGQILQNFVSNAIKFTSRGSITVEVEVQPLETDRVEVELRVIDTGIGIAEEDQDRIFEDFVMVDPSFGRSVGGTGLGLAISRRLSRAMGGEVGVESLPGEGSCFWLRLPLDLDTAPPSTLAGPPPDLPATPTLDVLVVEDNETNRIVLDEMLRHLGHRVTLAENGAAGVEAARHTRFDVVLMDLSMPLMDGWAAAAAIRTGGSSQHSRILAVTAHTRPDAVHDLARHGIDGWLMKPVSIVGVRQALSGDNTVNGFELISSLPPILDFTRQAELQQIVDSPGLHRLQDRFRQDMGETLRALVQAAENAPLKDLAALCHTGAGAAAVVGAARLQQDFASLEAACKMDDRAAFLSGLPAVQETWRATSRALCDLVGAS